MPDAELNLANLRKITFTNFPSKLAKNHPMARFRSYAEQSKHYFNRTHSSVPTGPIESPAAWLGRDLRDVQHQWTTHLSAVDIEELEHAMAKIEHRAIATEEVTAVNFELPSLAAKIHEWRQALASGLGFIVVKGLPVDRWGEEKSALAYWGIGHHLGLPGGQNPQGEVLGHVVDYGEEASNPNVRRYRTTGNIDFHCDAADVVGLLCLQPAKSGGQSRIVSSIAIFNEACKQIPDTIHRLFEPFALDLRDEQPPGKRAFASIQPCCWDGGSLLRTFYHSEYFRSAARLKDVEIDSAANQILDTYDQLGLDDKFHLDMWLETGDMQFVSNHTTLHARTAYEDWPEPDRRRHLLRLWLSL